MAGCARRVVLLVTTGAGAPERIDPKNASIARSFLDDTVRRVRRTPGALIGLGIVTVIVLAAILAPFVAPTDPLAQDLSQQALAPSGHHLFGTDKLGRDIFSRVVYGSRISIRNGFVAVGLAITVGTAIGLLAGYLRGRVDTLLMGATDVMLAFPSIILAIAITTVLGPSINNLVIAVRRRKSPGSAEALCHATLISLMAR